MLSKRTSPGFGVAVIALFVALGGTAGAAACVPRAATCEAVCPPTRLALSACRARLASGTASVITVATGCTTGFGHRRSDIRRDPYRHRLCKRRPVSHLLHRRPRV